MAFVRGLMGPYMRPIPVGASSAMVFSLLVAFVVSPWAALRLLHHYADRPESGHEAESWTTRFYRRLMNPLIQKPDRRWMFLGGVVVLLARGRGFHSAEVGAGQNAALRQQERIPSHHRHAGRHAAGTDHPRRAGVGKLPRRATGSHQLSNLFRHFGPLQLQRTWCGITSCAASPTKPTFRSTCFPERSQSAKPRNRAQIAAGTGQNRRSLRRAHQSRRSSARPAGARNACRGSVWAGLQGANRARRKDKEDFPGDSGCGGRRLVCRRSAERSTT